MLTSSSSDSSDPSDYNGDRPQGYWSRQQTSGSGYGAPSSSPLDGWVDSSDDVNQTRAFDHGYGPGSGYSAGYQNPQPGYGSSPGYAAQPGYPADYGYPGYNAYGMPPKSQKTKVAAALFAFFLGGTGAHNFYIGNTGRAIAQAVILVVSWVAVFGGYGMIFAGTETEMVTTYSGSYYYSDDEGLIIAGIAMLLASSVVMFSLWIWTIVEFIMILAASGRYARDKDGRILS